MRAQLRLRSPLLLPLRLLLRLPGKPGLLLLLPGALGGRATRWAACCAAMPSAATPPPAAAAKQIPLQLCCDASGPGSRVLPSGRAAASAAACAAHAGSAEAADSEAAGGAPSHLRVFLQLHYCS